MTFPRARALVAAAVAAEATPAAVVEVGRSADPIWREAFGRLSYDASAPPASPDTIFDLASLTKVIATTSLVMREIARQRLALETRVNEILEGWTGGGREAVRVSHLLDHSSGLPGHVRLWESAHGRLGYEAAVRGLALERPPGAASVYSDVGFMALGFVLEAVAGRSLDAQFDDLRRDWPSGLMFNPSPALVSRIAPTEYDATVGRPIRGQVHDENARAMDGVAGHAGLFGTANDVGAFARLVLRSFHTPTTLATPDLMRTFATPTVVPASSRALGWDTMRPTSSCGRRMSPSAIGHTGFTGTSLWVDPAEDLYVVLVTNRIHPTRTNEALLALRPQLHDAIVEDLTV